MPTSTVTNKRTSRTNRYRRIQNRARAQAGRPYARRSAPTAAPEVANDKSGFFAGLIYCIKRFFR